MISSNPKAAKEDFMLFLFVNLSLWLPGEIDVLTSRGHVAAFRKNNIFPFFLPCSGSELPWRLPWPLRIFSNFWVKNDTLRAWMNSMHHFAPVSIEHFEKHPAAWSRRCRIERTYFLILWWSSVSSLLKVLNVIVFSFSPPIPDPRIEFRRSQCQTRCQCILVRQGDANSWILAVGRLDNLEADTFLWKAVGKLQKWHECRLESVVGLLSLQSMGNRVAASTALRSVVDALVLQVLEKRQIYRNVWGFTSHGHCSIAWFVSHTNSNLEPQRSIY